MYCTFQTWLDHEVLVQPKRLPNIIFLVGKISYSNLAIKILILQFMHRSPALTKVRS